MDFHPIHLTTSCDSFQIHLPSPHLLFHLTTHWIQLVLPIYIHGYASIRCNVVNLPGPTPLKKTGFSFPRSHSFSIASRSGAEAHEPLPFHARMWTPWFCADLWLKPQLCEFMSTVALSWPEDTVSLWSYFEIYTIGKWKSLNVFE